MKILYGTGNSAKLASMKKYLQGLDITIIGLAETGVALSELPDIDEAGNDPLENAQIKAAAYFQFFKLPVFSCDSGLFIEGLSKERQPGVHVRNVAGKRLSDDEMIVHYAGLAKEMEREGPCVAQYRNGICLILDNERSFSHTGDDISWERFILSSVPHKKRREGFPLDSLSIHMPTGQYYFDIEEQETSFSGNGFRRFFMNALRVMNEMKLGKENMHEYFNSERHEPRLWWA